MADEPCTLFSFAQVGRYDCHRFHVGCGYETDGLSWHTVSNRGIPGSSSRGRTAVDLVR